MLFIITIKNFFNFYPNYLFCHDQILCFYVFVSDQRNCPLVCPLGFSISSWSDNDCRLKYVDYVAECQCVHLTILLCL